MKKSAGIVNDAIDTLNGMGAGTCGCRRSPGLDEHAARYEHDRWRVQVRPDRFSRTVSEGARGSLDDICCAAVSTERRVDGTFRRRNAVQSRESEASWTVLERTRAADREAITGAMSSRGTDTPRYPTIRRKAAPIGRPQMGCDPPVERDTGLPAMRMPAGAAEDGMPVALELLGRRVQRGTLLRVAYE